MVSRSCQLVTWPTTNCSPSFHEFLTSNACIWTLVHAACSQTIWIQLYKYICQIWLCVHYDIHVVILSTCHVSVTWGKRDLLIVQKRDLHFMNWSLSLSHFLPGVAAKSRGGRFSTTFLHPSMKFTDCFNTNLMWIFGKMEKEFPLKKEKYIYKHIDIIHQIYVYNTYNRLYINILYV